MSSWSSFPFVRITLVLISGIITGIYLNSYSLIALILCIVSGLICIFCLLFISYNYFYQYNAYWGCFGLLFIFLLGFLKAYHYQEDKLPIHLTHYANRIVAYEAVIIEDVQNKGTHQYTSVSIIKARINNKWYKIKGSIKLYVANMSNHLLVYGDKLLILGTPQRIGKPLNLHEFDYGALLSHSNIYHQHFVNTTQIIKINSTSPNLLKAAALNLRKKFENILTKNIQDKETYSIALALLLGIKESLPTTIKEAYAGTGAMHILAVSGLHVGMIYWLLNIILGCIQLAWFNKWMRAMLLFITIWMYAFITGLSPSVMRASTMFSFIIIAQLTGRRSNIYNTLSASAFILLCSNPFLLFSISFQLSYLAVVGIVYLQPKIYRWWHFSNIVLDKLWMLSSVSLAAQLATMPFSLYYFHQFPTYFLLANWVVVPASFFMLGCSILVIVTSFWNTVHWFVAYILTQIIFFVNQYIIQLNQLPFSQITNIYISPSIVVLLYIGIISLFFGLHYRKFIYICSTGIMALCIALLYTYQFWYQKNQNKIIFYSIYGHQAIAFVKGFQSIVCTDAALKTKIQKYTYHILPSQIAMGITKPQWYTFQEALKKSVLPIKFWKGLMIVVWNKKTILFFNDKAKYKPSPKKKIKVNYLVINSQSRQNMINLLPWIEFDQAIIGTSCSKNILQKINILRKNCHILAQKGYLCIE